MTAETARPHLNWGTKAIIAVDLFGNPAPYNDLYRLGLPVIEDACQAVGSTYMTKMCGAFGAAAAFSFYPSKNLAGCGDGGAVTTDDDEIARRVRLLRHHGSEDGRCHQEIGGTHRLDELQAAALRVRLPSLPDRIAVQREQARALMAEGHVLQAETGGAESSWHRHVTCEGDRQRGGRRYYETPLHQQPSMHRYWRCELPNAERFARTNVCLSPESTAPPK
jgi:dTDP-4-amino-4,6-dideoxygalactose transaminase